MRNAVIALVALVVATLSACATTGAATSKDASVENPMVLQLAHNLAPTHVTGKAIDEFANLVEERSGGRITVEVFANGVLGSEGEVIEQLRAGVVDITRVGAPNLATYNDGYHAFGLPFIFDDQDHYYATMDSPEMREFFDSSLDDGFITLTYYTSGARSFYTADTPIRTPEDLKGLKIRIQDMASQADMMVALGGTPVVLPFGDIYTSLQTGIIDGAESNETALTSSSHGEVSKVFSYDEHSMIPDVMLISSATWESLSPEDQELLIAVADESTQNHKVAWEEEIKTAIEGAKEMGVEFVEDVDREAFQEATAEMNEKYAKQYPGVADLLEIVEVNR